MKTRLLPMFLLTVAASLITASAANHDHDAKAKDEAKYTAPANYPLQTCAVSDEKLGGIGKPVEYVHKVAGKPDRVVLLCCESCIDEFKAQPAKYLKKIDDAAAAKAKK